MRNLTIVVFVVGLSLPTIALAQDRQDRADRLIQRADQVNAKTVEAKRYPKAGVRTPRADFVITGSYTKAPGDFRNWSGGVGYETSPDITAQDYRLNLLIKHARTETLSSAKDKDAVHADYQFNHDADPFQIGGNFDYSQSRPGSRKLAPGLSITDSGLIKGFDIIGTLTYEDVTGGGSSSRGEVADIQVVHSFAKPYIGSSFTVFGDYAFPSHVEGVYSWAFGVVIGIAPKTTLFAELDRDNIYTLGIKYKFGHR